MRPVGGASELQLEPPFPVVTRSARPETASQRIAVGHEIDDSGATPFGTVALVHVTPLLTVERKADAAAPDWVVAEPTM